ncbi:MAG: AhpC/TSA family protein [Gammaproteobacteria bacterium]|nr:MAG: AhpC/TSA family protein [Gammaproteobacteria bacterium]
MNILKSIFVTMYMMSAMLIMVFAAWSLWKTGDYLSWGGVLLVTAPFMMLLGWLMISTSIARTSERFPVLNGLGVLGVALASWGYFQGGSANAPILALIGWGGFLIYAYWYSSFGREPSQQLKVGQKLPEFKTKNTQGDVVSSALLTDKPAIWMFYRGAWCPLCMAQIKELVEQYKELQAMGVRVALVAPQPHQNTIGLAKKFGVEFDFLTDEGNQAARILGIANPQGLPMGMQMLGYDSETVLPTVIITDTNGIILWAHETDNYRVRPEPDVFLTVLRENQLAAAV